MREGSPSAGATRIVAAIELPGEGVYLAAQIIVRNGWVTALCAAEDPGYAPHTDDLGWRSFPMTAIEAIGWYDPADAPGAFFATSGLYPPEVTS